MLNLTKEDLMSIFFALEEVKGDPILMGAIANEIEILELEEVSFDDEDDGCAGGACKL